MPVRRVLFLGDVCAEPGRFAVKAALSGLRETCRPDFVIVNAENAAAGYGITPRLAEELFAAGADCLTTGDHAFDRKEAWEYFPVQSRLLRPANLPSRAPGRGCAVYERDGWMVGVVNLQGRVFMKPLDCPFQRAEQLVAEMRTQTRAIIVDFHAEATAEKQAMGWFLDGGVSAVLGTHTHVQTADEQVLPQGSAYITDVGMCGSFDSVLGMRKEEALSRVLDSLPVRLHPAKTDLRVNGVLVTIDTETGRAESIERITRRVEVDIS
ncbi:MAG: TIGR00282 family metallophosphoesterase [candidate division WOR-3 bacterium]